MDPTKDAARPQPAAQHPDARVIEAFYAAFARKDGAAMAALYHPQARFSDPVFPDLSGAEAGAMWRMFTRPDGDLRVEYRDVRAEGGRAFAHWDAYYRFPATGRPVVNRIDAEFELKDGLIHRHRDRFDFWGWSRQALGVPGVLLGWTPVLRAAVRKMAGKALRDFIAKSS